MIEALRSFSNDELQKMGRRVAVVRVENKKNKDYTLTKKTVKMISDDYTALHNSFNKIFANLKNIKSLQEAQSNAQITQNAFVPVGGKVIGTDQLIASISVLGKIFEDLAKQLDKLDLSPDEQQKQEEDCACDVGGEAEIDIDIDKKKKRRTRRTRNRGRGRGRSRGGRGSPRGGRLGMFGKALGALGAGLDLFDRLSGGESAVEAGVGVAGGVAGGWAGAEAGAALGALGGPAAAVTVPLGGLIGGALGYFGGSYLADKAYDSGKLSQAENQLVTNTSRVSVSPARREPTPINNNSYSSRFADYLRDTFENVSGLVGRTIGNVLDATGMLGDFGPGAGSTENAQIAMNFFMSPEGGGWSREQAAGIVGNLQGESTPNLNPNAVGDSGNAYGIAQWNQEKSPDRVANFKNVIGTDLRSSNFQQQLQFVAWELQNTEKAAGNKLRSAKDVQSATIAMSYYERYKGHKEELGSAETRTRIGNAQTIFEASKVSGGDLINPIPGAPLSSRYGPRDVKIGSKNHKGLDFSVGVGTPVKASHDGIVTVAGSVSGYGNAIYIDRGDGLQTRYGHLSRFKVKNGDRVVAGQDIADSGNTGRSSGPHLHFEVRLNGKPVDPLPYLRAKTQQPKIPTGPMSTSPLLMKPQRRRGDGSLLMINGQANPFMSTPPQVLFPNTGGRRAPMSVNPNSRDAMLRYHGL